MTTKRLPFNRFRWFRRHELILMMGILPLFCAAQSATFYVDTTDIINRDGKGKYVNEYLCQMEWKINGKSINYKSGKVQIQANPGNFDTLFYQQRPGAKWDTILCNITESKEYKFLYNHCCGGFDLVDSTRNRITGSIQFKIPDQRRRTTYLGTLGEVGLIVSPAQSNILSPSCRSAMSPNIYGVTLSAISPCKDSTNCPEGICLYQPDKSELTYDFVYRTKMNYLSFLYMPLSSAPLQIIWHPKSGKIEILEEP